MYELRHASLRYRSNRRNVIRTTPEEFRQVKSARQWELFVDIR